MKFHRKDMKSNPFKLKLTMKRTNAIMAGSSSAEATFDHNVIFSQFSLLQNVVTVWLSDLLVIWPSDDSNIVISKTKSVVVVIRHPSEENIELPEKLYSDNMLDDANWHWELRYVVTTETGSVPNKWKGRCFVCHDSQQFPQWWKYNRGAGEPVKLNSSELDANDYLLWDVAVFIQDDHDSFKHFHDAYLGYIGGQPNNNCKKHDMPLIAAVNRKGRQTQCTCMDGEASQWQCGKTGFLCCAKPGCPVMVCRRHAVLICRKRMKF
jgi:hypothetical protein